jgi:hypothetical protein
MAQAVECLLSNPKALSSNPSSTKKKKRKKRKIKQTLGNSRNKNI